MKVSAVLIALRQVGKGYVEARPKVVGIRNSIDIIMLA